MNEIRKLLKGKKREQGRLKPYSPFFIETQKLNVKFLNKFNLITIRARPVGQAPFFHSTSILLIFLLLLLLSNHVLLHIYY